jgi:hypothetical protein
MAPSCNDGVLNGTESDVDCGGGICPPCSAGERCRVLGDCESNNCLPLLNVCG